MINLNEHENQGAGASIPSGTRAMVQIKIIPPNVPHLRSTISPALTLSNTSDAQFMNCEFSIVSGPHKGKVFNQRFTVMGGRTDESGKSIAAKITGVTLKAIWDAHKGLVPTDMTQAAVNARMISDYTDFDGIFVPVAICIKENNGYLNNEIYHVITPDKEEYAKILSGADVEPLNIGVLGKGKGKAGNTAAQAGGTPPPWAQTSQEQPAQGFVPPAQTGASMSRPGWAK